MTTQPTLVQRALGLLRRAAASNSRTAWRDRAKAIANRKPAPHPYAKTTRDGHEVDQLTNYALYAAERRLGYKPGTLTILQGSYNAGVISASSGTHDGGGAVDLSAANWQEKVHALRAVGFAAWHRTELWRDGKRVWTEHVHAVLIGNTKLAPEAQDQVADYRNHRDGLASHAPDNTWHPNPIPTFHMPKWAQS